MSGKYHIVKSNDLVVVSRLLKPCPHAHRENGTGAVREFSNPKMFVTNFKGSAGILEKGKFDIKWLKSPEGIDVGNVVGLAI